MAFEVSKQGMSLTSPAKIEFPEYEKLKNDILKLVEGMKTVEVTEDTIQVNRRIISEVRKNVKLLDDERIKIKKQVLEPYNELDEKVKELKSYIAEGETHITAQVKAYEEAQALEREIALSEMFIRYQMEYNAPSWLNFDKFKLKYPNTLTKSCSEIKKKKAIIEYFDNFEKAYEDLKKRYPVKNVRTAILTSYKNNGFNMELAIADYEAMISEAKRLEEEKQARKETAVPKFSFSAEPVKKKAEPVKVNFEFESNDELQKALTILSEKEIKFKII